MIQKLKMWCFAGIFSLFLMAAPNAFAACSYMSYEVQTNATACRAFGGTYNSMGTINNKCTSMCTYTHDTNECCCTKYYTKKGTWDTSTQSCILDSASCSSTDVSSKYCCNKAGGKWVFQTSAPYGYCTNLTDCDRFGAKAGPACCAMYGGTWFTANIAFGGTCRNASDKPTCPDPTASQYCCEKAGGEWYKPIPTANIYQCRNYATESTGEISGGEESTDGEVSGGIGGGGIVSTPEVSIPPETITVTPETTPEISSPEISSPEEETTTIESTIVEDCEEIL